MVGSMADPSLPADRHAVVARVLADPPAVHPMAAGPGAPLGVWSTEPSCYRFIAGHCPPGARTLETGSGTSTVLLAALGAAHVCCTGGQEEADRILAHCAARGIDTSQLTFAVGSSHRTLPPLEAVGDERDLVLVDGSHAFPLPVVDWFYAAALLRRDGILVVDDVDLPAVRVLCRFLDLDPRWDPVGGTRKWRAWARRSSGTLSEDWTEQPFYRHPSDRLAHGLRWARGRARAALRGADQRAPGGRRGRRRSP
jgi:hypothetical protein